MKTIKKTSSNDLYLSGGTIAMASGSEAYCNIIESIIATQKGELQFDEDAGIDYFGTVFQSPRYIQIWAAQVKSRVEDLSFVTRVSDFEYDFNSKTSTLTWSMTVNTTDGEPLVLKNKRLIVDGSPGVDVQWGDVYDKPTGVSDVMTLLDAMRDQAQSIGGEFDKSTTFQEVKQALGSIIYEPQSAEYAKSRLVTFSFVGVPLGTVIDFSNLKINTSGTSYVVEISDGTKFRYTGNEKYYDPKAEVPIATASLGKVWFYDESKDTYTEGDTEYYQITNRHTIMARGEVSISIRGNVESIEVEDVSKPIFLTSAGLPFPYLRSVVIGKNVPFATVGDGAFRGFANLSSIEWNLYSDSTEISFGSYSFAGCSSLTGLSWIPKELHYVGEGCFQGCSAVETLNGFLLESSITFLPDYCFDGCSGLTTVADIPDSITSLGAYAFRGCTSLANISPLSDDITSLGEGCFSGCTGLTELLYPPETLVTIADRCFQDCTSLVSAYIPSSVTSVGEYAFAGCTALTNIMSDAAPTAESEGTSNSIITATTFDQDDLAIYVPPEYLAQYKVADHWKNYWDSSTSEGTIYKYGIFKFTLKEMSGLTLLATTSAIASNSIWTISYGDGTDVQRFENTVTTLPQHTYDTDYEEVETTITIKGYVTEMAAASATAYPFLATTAASEFSNLTAVEIRHSPLEKIGDYAFAQCAGLASFDLGFCQYDDDGNVVTDSDGYAVVVETAYCLGERSFYGCTSLTSTEWLTKGLGSLEDESSSTDDEVVYYDAFGEGCFYNSGVADLKFAKDYTTSLPGYCFAGTQISNLKELAYNGVDEYGLPIETDIIASFGESCFRGCSALTTLYGLDSTSVKTLPDYCFAECESLTYLTGVNNLVSEVVDEDTDEVLEEMGEYVFYNCTSLASIAPLVHKEDSAAPITSLPAYTFAGCTSLKTIGMEKRSDTDGSTHVATLGEHCFEGCTSLADISGLLNNTEDLVEIPAYCFAGCTSLRTLIGCEYITTIDEYAFSGCSLLLSSSGLGADISSIGAYAFQNCTRLQYFTCIASTPPSLEATTFSGSTFSSIPLFVREGRVSSYSDTSNPSTSSWASAATIASRTIKISLASIQSITADNIATSRLQSSVNYLETTTEDDEATTTDYSVPGVWYVDYGDGSGIKTFYNTTGDADAWLSAIAEHEYMDDDGELLPASSYTLTFFGDITGIGCGATEDEQVYSSSFLGSKAESASSVLINAATLESIEDYCFYKYGFEDSSLQVNLAMASDASVGAHAFESPLSPIGEIATCTAATIGESAFRSAGLTSSSCFTTVTAIGDYAFADNATLLDLSGFESLTMIGESAFENCTALTSTSGLSNAVDIGERAFKNCTGLATIQGFGGNLEYIREEAFAGCGNISTIFMAVTTPPKSSDESTEGSWLDENTFEAAVYDSAVLYVAESEIETYQDSKYSTWNKFADIRARSLTLYLSGVGKNDRIAEGMGTITSSGSWVLSIVGTKSDGTTQKYTKTITDATYTLQAYSFGNDLTNCYIKFSGPITGITCSSSAYPLCGKANGSNPWLVKVEGDAALELTSLDDYVFAGCSNLTAVTECPSVVSVGSNCFNGCSSLTDISGLESVASIEEYGFSGCSALTSLYGLSSVSSIGARAFNGCSALKTIDGLGTGVSSIGDYAFSSCPLTEVQMFSETPPLLGTSVFNGLDTTSVPLYVRSKSLSAYQSSSAWAIFTDVRTRTLSFTLTGCAANTTVDCSYGRVGADTYWVVDWESGTSDFEGTACKSGMVTTMPSHTYSIAGNHTFYIEGAVTSISSADDPTLTTTKDGMATEEPYYFIGNPFIMCSTVSSGSSVEKHYLTAINGTEYNTLKEIGKGTFLNCSSLTAVYLVGVTTYGYAACAYTGLTSTELLTGATSIADYAFYGCLGLTAITNLNSLETPFSIGSYAFGGVDRDADDFYIQCGATIPPTITDNSFGVYENKKDVYVYVPLASYDAYNTHPYWGQFTIASQTIYFELEDVPSGTTILGVSSSNTEGTGIVLSDSTWTVSWNSLAADGSQEQSVMAASTRSFPSHTYQYDSSNPYDKGNWKVRTENGVSTYYRESVTIAISGTITALKCYSNGPFLATVLGEGNPYLKRVYTSEMMKTLTELGANVFQGCENLESIEGFTNVTTLGDFAFQGCTSLTSLGTSATGFANLTSIGSYAFQNCTALTSLVAFPKVLNIGTRAFSGCTGLRGTSGLGSDYATLPMTTIYPDSDKVVVGKYLDIFEEGKTIYPIEDFDFDEKDVTYGWRGDRVVITDDTGIITAIQWPTILQEAYFGSYAFDECAFGIIEMAGYTYPPTIQTTTFYGDPAGVMVFAPSGSVDTYKAAPVWKLYYDNIIDEAPISIKFGANQIIGGVAIVGDNGRLNFEQSYVAIDWGDNTSTTFSGDDTISTWTFPTHIYSDSFTSTAPVTIKIRGNVKSMYCIDKDKPFLSLAGVTTTKVEGTTKTVYNTTWENTTTGVKPVRNKASEEEITTSDTGDTTTNEIDEDRITNYRVEEFAVGQQTSITGIGYCEGDGGGCFAGVQIVKVSLGKPASGKQITIGSRVFADCASLISVSATTGAINTIGEEAFSGCTSLTDIDFITEGLEYIGNSAFSNCTQIRKVALPSTLVSVGDEAFYGCSGITAGISWRESTDESILGNTDIYIGEKAFAECSGTTSDGWTISVAGQVKQIKDKAFYHCGMTTFTWSPSESESSDVSFSIGKNVFQKCSSLKEVDFDWPAIEEIPEYSFEGCTNLGSIDLSHLESVQTIGDYAFSNCGETSLILPAAVLNIGNYAFYKNINLLTSTLEREEANSPNLVLGEWCFADCTSLTTIEWTAKIQTLPKYCFFRNEKLTNIDGILENVSGLIGAYCFAGCKNLESVIIPETVTGLLEGCFNCSLWLDTYSTLTAAILANVELAQSDTSVGIVSMSWNPSSVAANPAIGKGCFMNCSRLANVSLGEKVTGFGDYSFYNDVGLKNLDFIPETVIGLGAWSFANCSTLSSLAAFPPLVTTLNQGVFYGCTGFENDDVELISTNITTLGARCFENCSNAGFTVMPGFNVTKYPSRCFYGCSSLEEVLATFSSSAMKGAPNQIDAFAFAGCPSIKGVYLTSFTEGVVTYSENDPFQDIYDSEEDQYEAELVVPESLIGSEDDADSYKGNSYWQKFKSITNIRHREYTPVVSEFALHLTINVSTSGARLEGAGSLLFSNNSGGRILWGDGESTVLESSKDALTHLTGSEFTHTYNTTGTKHLYIVSHESGGITEIYGNSTTKKAIFYAPLASDLTITDFACGDSITKIGNYTFFCTGIQTLNGLTSSIEELGDFAFAGDTSLQGQISNIQELANTKVEAVPASCFAYNANLKSLKGVVNIKSFGANSFRNTGIEAFEEDLFTTDETITFDSYVFYNCTKLGNTAITNFPTKGSIQNAIGLFRGCSSINSLEGFTLRISTFPKRCFGRTGLTSLETLPESINVIQMGTFEGCQFNTFDWAWMKNVTSIIGSESESNPDTSLGGAFEGCAIGNFTNSSSDSSVVTSLGNRTFYGNNLTSLDNLPTSITSLGAKCFYGCSNLEDIKGMGNNIETIGVSCFESCAKLKDLNGLSTNINFTRLPDYCFRGCTGLTSLEGMGTNIKTLGTECFSGCSSLVSLKGLSTNVSEIGKSCFASCSLEDLFGLDKCSKLATIPTLCFAYCENLGSVILYRTDASGKMSEMTALPENIEAIEAGAFLGCTNIKHIVVSRYAVDEDQGISITELNGQVFDTIKATIHTPSEDAQSAYQGGWLDNDHFGEGSELEWDIYSV